MQDGQDSKESADLGDVFSTDSKLAADDSPRLPDPLPLKKQPSQAQGNGNPSSTIGKYSGLGFQLLACIGLFTWGGYAADHALHHSVQWMTAIFSLAGVCIGLFLVLRQTGS